MYLFCGIGMVNPEFEWLGQNTEARKHGAMELAGFPHTIFPTQEKFKEALNGRGESIKAFELSEGTRKLEVCGRKTL